MDGMSDAINDYSNQDKKTDETLSKQGKRLKHLVFTLSNEKYGILLSSVKEVIGLTDITPVPHVPSYFKGLINLRGRIISIVDLRIKMNLPEAKYVAKRTSIIITEIDDLMIGTIVDDVNEVVGFTQEQMESDLEIQSSISREFITGVAKTQDKNLILLLDIGKALSADDRVMIKKEMKK